MKQHESKLQALCVKWFKFRFPKFIIFAVPNGGSRNPIEAKRLQSEGVLPGVADLVVVLKNQILFIEMKHGNTKQSDNQKLFEQRVGALGFKYFVCRSFDDFKSVVTTFVPLV